MAPRDGRVERPETYFWREVDQIHAVVDRIVPELVAHLRAKPLRIWSVPCASGEEPLTLAMLLEEGGWFERAPIEICAGDASRAALDRAKAGVFRERSFRALPVHLQERYFRHERTALAGRAGAARAGSRVAADQSRVAERAARRWRQSAHRVLPQRLHLLLGRGRAARRRGRLREPCRDTGILMRRRVRIAAAADRPLRARGSRRRVHLRQTIAPRQDPSDDEHCPCGRDRRLRLRAEGRSSRCCCGSPFIDVVGTARDGAEGARAGARAQPRRRDLRPQHAGDGRRRVRARSRWPGSRCRSSSSASRASPANRSWPRSTPAPSTSCRSRRRWPPTSCSSIADELVEKVKAAAQSPLEHPPAAPRAGTLSRRPARRTRTAAAAVELVVIGASTGGPQALKRADAAAAGGLPGAGRASCCTCRSATPRCMRASSTSCRALDGHRSARRRSRSSPGGSLSRRRGGTSRSSAEAAAVVRRTSTCGRSTPCIGPRSTCCSNRPRRSTASACWASC